MLILWIAGGIIVLIVLGAAVAGRWFSSRGYNYGEMSWSEAFEQLHAQVSNNYPFTEWKDIDWDDLYARTAPIITQAEADNDPEAYYLALREYTYAIPDGHAQLGGEDFGLREISIGGGYGLGIIGLDDGRVIAHVLLKIGLRPDRGSKWGPESCTGMVSRSMMHWRKHRRFGQTTPSLQKKDASWSNTAIWCGTRSGRKSHLLSRTLAKLNRKPSVWLPKMTNWKY